MEALEKRILRDGEVLPGNILKVDSFINHMIDPMFMMEMGEEFKKRFGDLDFDKVLTMEVSGIAPGFGVGAAYKKPVLFAKKTLSKTLGDDVYESTVQSFTKGTEYKVRINKKFLKPGEKVLIIDDFLAKGRALTGLIDLCQMAQVEIVGIGVLIEKFFQAGGEEIRKMGYPIEALVQIEALEDGQVIFKKRA